jgi:hypothetical protein
LIFLLHAMLCRFWLSKAAAPLDIERSRLRFECCELLMMRIVRKFGRKLIAIDVRIRTISGL